MPAIGRVPKKPKSEKSYGLFDIGHMGALRVPFAETFESRVMALAIMLSIARVDVTPSVCFADFRFDPIIELTQRC